MRGVRFTKAEAEWLRTVMGVMSSQSPSWDWSCFGTKVEQHAGSILKKLDAADAPLESDHDAPKALQDALSSAARGKVVPLEGGWAMAAGMAKNAKATVEQARLIGEWMARQGWLTQPQTLLDVLRKWPSWLAKAKATQPPPSLEPGLGKSVNAVVPQKPRKGSGVPPGLGRTVPGLR